LGEPETARFYQTDIAICEEVIMPGKSVRENRKKVRKEIPLVVWLWTMGLGFLSYLVARIALYTLPHPVHWTFGAAGLVLGFSVGWLWYRWKGDVV
jgi:CHASE2 domain-containing sensor protein